MLVSSLEKHCLLPPDHAHSSDGFRPRNSGDRFVLLMHIPIYFPGITWGPSDVMGHPMWGRGRFHNSKTRSLFFFFADQRSMRRKRCRGVEGRPKCESVLLESAKLHIVSWIFDGLSMTFSSFLAADSCLSAHAAWVLVLVLSLHFRSLSLQIQAGCEALTTVVT